MTGLPLYKKIVQDLKAEIISQKLAPHDQVPTELELSNQYGVSRITSKRALTELENEKLIYRIQGKGSFVSEGYSKEKNDLNPPKDLLFVSPFANNPDLGNYAQGMLKYLQQTSYKLHIHPDTILDQMDYEQLTQQYRGIILYPCSSSSHLDLLYTLYLNNFPTLILDKNVEGIPFPTVTADNFQGGYDATQHLISLGHEKIMFLLMNDIEYASSTRERYLGYLKAIHDAKLNFTGQCIFPPEHNEAALIEFFEIKVLGFQNQHMTGIVAENDIIAIHFMNFVHKQGLKIPEDFSIVGFDNLQASSLVVPPLTTVSQDFAQMGYLVVKQLISIIEKDLPSTEKINVPVELMIRDSTQHKN